MITANQMRAARALLNLSQDDATKGAGISLNTLSKSESGSSEPSAETTRKLQHFYEGCGIVFLEDDGVKSAVGDREYRGEHGIRRFFDDVYEAARHGTDICIFNGSPDQLIEWAGEEFYHLHAERMTGIKSRFTVRVIVKEGEQNLIGASFAEYRGIDIDQFKDRMIYVYGDKVAIFSFENKLLIKVSRDKDLADSMRVLFRYTWDAAK